MKKGEIFELEIVGINFSGEGYGEVNEEKYYVKSCIPKEKVKCRYLKVKSGKKMCKLIEKIEESPISINPVCNVFGKCGGCTYLNLTYEDQIKYKEQSFLELLKEHNIRFEKFSGVTKAVSQFKYRNKMEFSFGDEVKDGPLELGLHKKGNPFSIVPTYDCHLVSDDFKEIVKLTIEYFRKLNVKPYKTKNHTGYLRNLILREGKDEILICLVTSSQETLDLNEYKNQILNLKLNKKVGSLLHVISDSLSDAIQPKETYVLHGNDYIYEEVLGLKFKINLFSFFQTNTEGMKLLYEIVRDNIKCNEGVILDLYCGIGTIGQIISTKHKNKVIGIEIVEDAVKMAIENAKLNNLECEFIQGDVTKVVENIKEKISYIVVDPPRSGIMEKGVRNICKFNVENIVYVSCNPKSLMEDLKIFIEERYIIKNINCVDMFPNTYHMETVVLLSNNK